MDLSDRDYHFSTNFAIYFDFVLFMGMKNHKTVMKSMTI